MAKLGLDSYVSDQKGASDEKVFEGYSEGEVIEIIQKVRSVTWEGAKSLFDALSKEKVAAIIAKYEGGGFDAPIVNSTTSVVPTQLKKVKESKNMEEDVEEIPQHKMQRVSPTNLVTNSEATPVLSLVMTVEEAIEQFKLLKDVVKRVLVSGEDYGIPEPMRTIVKKPFLYKAGAAKLANIFGLSPEFEIVERIEDFTTNTFRFMVKCRLVAKKTGVLHGESIGAASSDESRFKNRKSAADNWYNVYKHAEKRAFVSGVKQATRLLGEFEPDESNHHE